MNGSGVGLFEPVLTGGIRNTHFFNGRLLTGEDLRAEQEAHRAHGRQLARAMGAGVSHGLEVRLGAPAESGEATVRVSEGLGFNRDGDPIALAAPTTVRLVAAEGSGAGAAGDVFKVCQPPRTTVRFNNLGLYVLTVRPASGFEGRAPVTEVGGSLGVGTTCQSRYAVEGAQFGVVPLDLGTTGREPTALESEVATLIASLEVRLAVEARRPAGSALPEDVRQMVSRLRNLVAYLCFGVERLGEFAIDPFPGARAGAQEARIPLGEYGLLDALRASRQLASCDLPLAVIYWTSLGVGFVDMWSVRRPLTAPASSSAWPHPTSARREVEGMAMVLQFQEHLRELVESPGARPDQVRAVEYFRYLPPVGMVPLLSRAGNAQFDHARLFDGRHKRDPVYIEGRILHDLVTLAVRHAPIDLVLDTGDTSGGELIWLYRIRETMQGFAASPRDFTPYLVFTNGHVPYHGARRFDLAYWNYANYV